MLSEGNRLFMEDSNDVLGLTRSVPLVAETIGGHADLIGRGLQALRAILANVPIVTATRL